MKLKGRKGLSVVCALLVLGSAVMHCSANEDIRAVDLSDCGQTPITEMVRGDIKVSSRLWELLFGSGNDKTKELLLVPGGNVFGAKVKQSYVTISDAGDTKGAACGDIILSLDGKEVRSLNDIKEAVLSSGGKAMNMVCSRGGSKVTIRVLPKKHGEEYRLGMVLKDGAAGIGTITYIDPMTGAFGGLGHGICDAESGMPIEISKGEITGVILGGVQKGEAGKPGELCGILTDKHLGEVYSNTACGLFGKLDKIPADTDARLIKVASREQVHEGEATIYSTIKNGSASEFKIKITEIDKNSNGSKSFKIKVTDPALIAMTGGIVRGMSGSPIIQDGRLVGAVTHVCVNL